MSISQKQMIRILQEQMIPLKDVPDEVLKQCPYWPRKGGPIDVEPPRRAHVTAEMLNPLLGQTTPVGILRWPPFSREVISPVFDT